MTDRASRSRSPLAVSFEFFPPKTEAMEAQLWRAVETLTPMRPEFVSVTYGAGGSTRERTHAVVTRLQREVGLRAAAHLTCVQATREEIDAVAQSYWSAGIRHIVALRGDPQGGMAGDYVPTAGGYAYANELVRGLRALHPFEISVAAYPEGHPQAPSLEADIASLKRKIDAGATRAITQFFFDPVVYARFRDRTEKAGIAVPIIPGVLPLANFARAAEMAKGCGARMPGSLSDRFDRLVDDPAGRREAAIEVAVELCESLRGFGVTEFHFYTLNRAELVLEICRRLGN
jgi:methylenetetrahydrofolate reductase (NADPH)